MRGLLYVHQRINRRKTPLTETRPLRQTATDLSLQGALLFCHGTRLQALDPLHDRLHAHPFVMISRHRKGDQQQHRYRQQTWQHAHVTLEEKVRAHGFLDHTLSHQRT